MDIIKAIKLKIKDKNHERARNASMYKARYAELSTKNLLYSQLNEVVRRLYAEPNIESIQVSVNPAATKFIPEVIEQLDCEVVVGTNNCLVLFKGDVFYE